MLAEALAVVDKTDEHFYEDPELYAKNEWLAELRSADPTNYGWSYDDQLPWVLRQSFMIYEMKRLLLDPEGIELYVENRSSALWPTIPEAPASMFVS